jgi:CRISPR-associated protein Cmr1
MASTSWHPLTLTAETPMFLGRFDKVGVTGDQIAFPVPSLRGALAYWLRTLAGAHVGDNLASLAQAESAVFGGARTRNAGGPSTIWIRGRLVGVNRYPGTSTNVAYLMGPGLRDTKAPAARHLRPGATISLAVRNTGGPAHADLFLSALWALRTFGGIGARARRGFGTVSVNIQQLKLPCDRFQQDWLYRNSADDLPDVLACVADTLTELGIPRTVGDSVQPRYPRFDLPGEWYLLEPDIVIPDAQSNEAALAWLGEHLRTFRLDGDDYVNTAGYREIVRPYLNGTAFSAPYRAGALGLPVVYTEKATQPGTEGRSATVEPVVDGQSARRASPLWLRVHQRGRAWRLRSLVFNAEWLPDTANLQVKANPGTIGHPQPVQPPSADLILSELKRWFAFVSAETSG